MEQQKCRGCGKLLSGSGQSGSTVYDPATKQPAKWNHYGGYVCSRDCDRNASLELEQSMPGHGWSQKTIGSFAAESLKRNWGY